MSENIARYNVILELVTRQEEANKSLKNIENQTTGLRGVFMRAKAAFAGIIAAQAVTAAVGGITTIARRGVQLAETFEQTQISFNTLIGDVDRAKKLFEDLDKFAIETPFEDSQIQSSAKTLLGFGRTAEQVLDDLKLIGNAAAATGSDLGNLALVFGQVAGAGKLQGQDALQFINAGIPIYQILSESLGVTVGQVKELQSQGKITFDVLREGFAKASEEGGKFAGALLAQSTTFGGLISTFNGVFDTILRNLGQVFLPIAKELLPPLIDGLFRVVNFFKENGEQITKFTIQVGNFLSNTFSFIAKTVQPIIDRIRTSYELLSARISNTKVAQESINLLSRSFNVLANVAKTTLDVLLTIVDFFTTSQNVFARFGRGIVEGLLIVVRFVPSIANGIVEVFKEVGLSVTRFAESSVLGIRILYEEAKILIGTGNKELLKALQTTRFLLSKEGRSLNDAFLQGFLDGERAIIKIPEVEDIAKNNTNKTPKGDDPKPPTGDGSGDKDALKKAFEANKELIELNFALRENDARRQITTAENLAKTLEQIEIEKNIALLINQRNYSKESSAEFVKLSNQIIELESKYTKLFQSPPSVKLPSIYQDLSEAIETGLLFFNEQERLIREKNALQTITNEQELQDELTKIELEGEIKRLEILKQFTDATTNEYLAIEVKLLELQNRLKSLGSSGTTAPQNIFDSFLTNLLGIDGEKLEQFKSAVTEAVQFARQATLQSISSEISLTDQQLALQEKRVQSAIANAEKGKSEQLAIEEERLNELQKKREDFVEAQRALATLEITAANAVAAAKSIEAISKAFSAGPVGNIPLGIATTVALGAQIATIVFALKSQFSDLPAFNTGIERFRGKGTRKSDSNIARLSIDERVVDAATNEEIGFNFPNKKLPDAVKLYKMFPRLARRLQDGIYVSQTQGSASSDKVLHQKVDALTEVVSNMRMTVKLDKEGFLAAQQVMQQKVIKRKNLRS